MFAFGRKKEKADGSASEKESKEERERRKKEKKEAKKAAKQGTLWSLENKCDSATDLYNVK